MLKPISRSSHFHSFSSAILSFRLVIVSAWSRWAFASIPIFRVILCGCNMVCAQYMAGSALSKKMKVRFQTADSCILASTSDDCTQHTPESSCPAKSSLFHTWKRFFLTKQWPHKAQVVTAPVSMLNSGEQEPVGSLVQAGCSASGINIRPEPYGKAW